MKFCVDKFYWIRSNLNVQKFLKLNPPEMVQVVISLIIPLIGGLFRPYNGFRTFRFGNFSSRF